MIDRRSFIGSALVALGMGRLVTASPGALRCDEERHVWAGPTVSTVGRPGVRISARQVMVPALRFGLTDAFSFSAFC